MATLAELLTDKIPPHNMEAERLVLGNGLLEGASLVTRLAPSLKPEDFYLEAHRALWAMLRDFALRGDAVDLPLIAHRIRADGIEEIHGEPVPAFLAGLTEEASLAVNVDSYARLILEAAGQRETVRVAVEAVERAYKGDSPAAIITSLTEALQLAVTSSDPAPAHMEATGPVAVRDVLDDLVRNLDVPETDLVPTPVPELTERLGGGLLKGELIYLGGRPGTAKTALAIQWAALAGDYGHRTLVISREMKNAALGRRLLAQQAQVSATSLRKRDLDLDERQRILRVLPRLGALPLWFDDASSTLGHVKRWVRTLRPRLLVVDYIQLLRAPDGKTAPQQRRLEVTAVSAGLKDIAMRYDCSVLALSALRRIQTEKGQGGKRGKRPDPTYDDLKESGDLEADADVIVLLHQPDPNERDRKMIFAKLREGESGGSVTLAWTPAYVRFTEVPIMRVPASLDPDDPQNEVPF